MKIHSIRSDRRISMSRSLDVGEALSLLLHADTALGNVSSAPLDLRRVVGPRGGVPWVVNRRPDRQKRPGLGQNLAPSQSPIFRDRILETGRQCWLEADTDEGTLFFLSNPNPHIDGTVTVTVAKPEHQGLRNANGRPDSARVRWIVRLAATLCDNLPGRYVSFNAEGGGNSLSQLHFSVNGLPSGMDRFPVEAYREGGAGNGECSYPAPYIAVRGTTETVVGAVAAAISAWDIALDRTVNLVFRQLSSGTLRAFLWPRSRLWRRAPGFNSGEIAFMELCGFFIASDQQDLAAIDNGVFDHGRFANVLRSIVPDEAPEFCASWAELLPCGV